MHRGRSSRFAALLFGAPQLLAAGGPCADSVTVAAEIERIGARWNIDVDPTSHKRTEALCTLADREARNVEALIACQDARATGQQGLEEERARAKRLHEEDPDSPVRSFLWARLLPDGDAAPIADGLVARQPDFPWGHFLKASAQARRAGKADQETLKRSLGRFFDLCPESAAAYRFASSAADSGFVLASAGRLRALLARQPLLASPYPTLWQLEFKGTPPSGHDAIRAKVREDLERIEPRLLGSTNGAWILQAGHDLLGDPAARAAMEERVLAAIPGTFVTFQIEESRFERLHPGWEPEAVFRASTGWIRRWPDYPIPWSHRLGALRELPGATDDEAIRTGEGLLRALERRPFDVSSLSRPFQIRVAEAWVSRGIRLREVVRLADTAIEETDRYLRARALFTPRDFQEVLDDVRWLGRPLRVEALASTGRRGEAARILSAMEFELPTATVDLERLRAASRRSILERARAGLALADGRAEEALTHYRAALHMFDADSRSMPEPAEAARRARLLLPANDSLSFDRWLADGGAVPAAVSSVAFEKRDRPLPRAILPAFDGPPRSIPDPEKRTLVAVVWATWCGPCRAELPHVQALYAKLGTSPRVAVVTLSIDENPGLVAPFVREHRYTFPVLLAKDYVAGLPERDLFVPRTWIVSPEGRVVLESRGFAWGEPLETWLRRVEGALASVSGSSRP